MTLTVGAKKLLDFSQLSGRYTDLPLGRKLAERGVSASKLAEVATVSRADVSNYLHGKRQKIGHDRRKRISRALCEMGVLKPRVRKPPVCKQCGLAYPTRRHRTEKQSMEVSHGEGWGGSIEVKSLLCRGLICKRLS